MVFKFMGAMPPLYGKDARFGLWYTFCSGMCVNFPRVITYIVYVMKFLGTAMAERA